MPRPRIGITTDYNDQRTQYALNCTYAASVEQAGGLPFMLAYRMDVALIPELLDCLDGILLVGGEDLDPSPWGEPRHLMARPIDPPREIFERALLVEIERRRTPTLGVCLGSQLMNVHRGGTLHQFLPDLGGADAIEHRRMDDWSRRHTVRLVEGTVAYQAIGKTEVVVNTSHKQAIRELGRGLRVVATAPDGVIEGVEDPSFPLFLGVQWHPERMSDESDHAALFRLLVERARFKRE